MPPSSQNDRSKPQEEQRAIQLRDSVSTLAAHFFGRTATTNFCNGLIATVDSHYCSISIPPCTTHSWTTVPLSLTSDRRCVRTSSAVMTLPPPLVAPIKARPIVTH